MRLRKSSRCAPRARFFLTVAAFAGIFGPFLFASIIGATGSSRNAILAVIVLFIAGGVLLTFVDVKEGERVARAAEAATRPVPAAR